MQPATPPAADLTEWIEAEAKALGFHLVGFAPAESFPEAESHALQWLAEGRQADMRWLTAERVRLASRPNELMPGARSFIALGVSYRQVPAESADTASGPRGRIARYAGGADYHDLLRERMRDLVDRIGQHLGFRPRARLFVDSSPLLEREVAVRAGLGFFGKNSTLLAAGGSYYLLGAILTDLDLRPNQPIQKDCGQCRLCIDACPTDALYDDHSVDATRCISYLTIELRGSIPLEHRSRIGSWVFGCDVCQEVCPYNHGRGPIAWPELRPRPVPGLTPDLVSLLNLDEAQHREAFRGSPLKRAKRRGLLRNAAVALGNSGDPRAVPPLIHALSHPEPLVRGHAAWALSQLGGTAALTAIRNALQTEQDPEVQAELEGALAHLSA